MKPNDKAIEAGVKLCWDYPRATPSIVRKILTAAYAAQFQSDDYAGLIERLRKRARYDWWATEDDFSGEAADAIEAVLAERDALKSELIDYKDAAASEADFVNEQAEKIRELKAERGALAARLAPVDDEALVEIAAEAISTYVPNQVSKWGSIKDAAIDAIAAIRPHIEAVERERCAKIADKHEHVWHSELAHPCARAIAAAIRSGSGSVK